MIRLLPAVILLGSCCHAFASEPPSPAATAQYTAKIKFLRVDSGKQTIALNTDIIGTKGKPLKTALAGKDGLTLAVKIDDVPGSRPTQYLAQFKLVEIGKNGKENILSAPALVTTVGTPAKLMVGQERGNRIEIDLVVIEGVSAASQPKPARQEPTDSKQPPATATSSLGTSLMMTVHPRIIIQEEEEEKLGIVPAP